jgi:hypothetical protein
VAGLLSYDGTPTASIPFAQKVQRECAQCRVVIAIEREIERLEVPLVGSHRTAYWCLRKDGNLRNLRLPDGHTNVLMLADVDPAAPWLGYARFAA